MLDKVPYNTGRPPFKLFGVCLLSRHDGTKIYMFRYTVVFTYGTEDTV